MSDHRNYKRIDESLHIKIRILALGGSDYDDFSISSEADSINISSNGILILSDRRLPEGTLMDIEILAKNSPHPINAKGKVVRIDFQDDGKYLNGVQFTHIFPADQELLNKHIDKATG